MAVLDFYGMFDYATGDNDTYKYSSAEFSELIAGVTGNGVSANTLNSFETTISALKLTVKSGVCFINGRYGANHASKTVTISSVASGSKRYDRLVIELSIPKRNMDLKLVKGTASTGTPAIPALTQNDSTWQLPLYLCLVSGSTATLTDQRPMTYSVAQIQTELQNRSLVGHGHALSEITGISINTSASNIKMDGTASAGTGTSLARANHVHPTDTSRAAASHTHALGDVTGISINTSADNIQMDGTVSAGTGTALARANHVHPTDTSRAAASHNHAASAITSGTLAVARGGTGQTTLANAANSLINALSTADSTPADADYYVSQYAKGGTTTTTYHRRPLSALWAYIKGKADAVYAALSHTHALADVTGISLNTTATNIKMNGTQSAGSGTSVAKANHVHPVDTSRAAASHTHVLADVTGISLNSTATNIKMNGTQSAGSGTAVALANHVHPVDTSRAAASHTHALADVTGISLNSTATNIKMNGTQSAGSGTAVALANHVHPVDTSRAAASHKHALTDITGISLNTTATNIKMNGTQSAGSGTAVALANHVHPVDTSRAASSHNHDSRYYTETEMDTKLSNIFANASATTASTTDLNTFKTGGIYNIWVTGTSPKNSPVSGGGFHILVVMSYGSYGIQICFCSGAYTSTTKVYVRTFFDNGTFQEWKILT
ncbi:MAG: hypothetical protein IJ766_04905 [Clostridia bacterium]|nr:hypothetical protein [Clostridia bacterium]